MNEEIEVEPIIDAANTTLEEGQVIENETQALIESLQSEFQDGILQSEFQGGIMTGAIRNMVGIPPKGFEFIEYAVGSAMYIILFAVVVSVFVGFSKVLGAR